MSLAADRPEFAPPPQRGTFRALLLALIAHALLIIALTWGVSWRREAENDAVEAELWSSTIQQAAPRAVAPTPPAPAPAPTPAPPPPPPPPQAARPPEPAPPPPKQPDIALEREKKLREQKEREQEEARQQQQKKLEAARKAAQEKKEQEARERERAEQEAERKEQQQKLAEAKKKQEAEAAKKKEAEAKATAQAAADRAATLKRMQAMAGTGGEGNAARSSGPSGNYAGRIQAAIRPNITYPDVDTVSGNPMAEFDVRLAPDGTIVGVKLLKSSGVPGWDDAAERALKKTDKLPRNSDGTVPSVMAIQLRPKER